MQKLKLFKRTYFLIHKINPTLAFYIKEQKNDY